MQIGIGLGVSFLSKVKKLLLKATFNQADNAASLGTPEIGQAWILTGTWGTIGNKAYCSSDVSADHARAELGTSDFTIKATVQGKLADGALRSVPNISFRVKDNGNMLLARVTMGNLEFLKISNSVNTALATVPVTIADYTDFDMMITCKGASVIIAINGVVKVNHTLSAADVTEFSPYTKVGMRLTKSGTATGARWDNFIVEV